MNPFHNWVDESYSGGDASDFVEDGIYNATLGECGSVISQNLREVIEQIDG